MKSRFLQVVLAPIKWCLDDTKTYARTKIEILRLENRIAQLEKDLRSLES